MAERNNELSLNERDMLNMAYKEVIGELRASFRVLSSAVLDADAGGDLLQQETRKLAENYRVSVCGMMWGPKSFINR